MTNTTLKDVKMTNIKSRIIQFAKYEGVALEDFFNKIGVSYSSFKGSSKKTGLNSDTIDVLVTMFPKINLDWLITGEGEMLKSTTKVSVVNKNLIPLVGINAIAGFGSTDWSIEPRDIKGEYLVPDFNGIDFMIYVKGSSMYPKYSSGDIVACKKVIESSFLQWNKAYVVATKSHGIMVKRLHQSEDETRLKMVSDNKDYPPFEVEKEEITGIALVVGVIRLE